MARAALDHLKLDKLIFMPTGAPHYRTPAAIAGNDSYEIDARELGPGATGYTFDTLRELRLELGVDTPLWLLMGADQYAKLDSWHRPQDVKKLARIAVFARPGVSIKGGISLIPMDPMPISASEIRARVARGEDISRLVPAAVAATIAREGLYR
jgi:nicotinate-nucleotide adenylyltransferase